MRILGIDSTKEKLLIVVVNGDAVFFSETDGFSKHNKEIIVMVEETLKKASLEIADIDVFSAVTGPGSFTGIRVGVCTANGFSYALSKKLVDVNAFEIIFEDAKIQSKNTISDVGFDANDVALIDALHGNHFYAKKSAENEKNNLVFGYVETDPVEAFKGSRLMYQADIKDYVQSFASVLKRKAMQGEFSATLLPLYLRKSQAERLAGDVD